MRLTESERKRMSGHGSLPKARIQRHAVALGQTPSLCGRKWRLPKLAISGSRVGT